MANFQMRFTQNGTYVALDVVAPSPSILTQNVISYTFKSEENVKVRNIWIEIICDYKLKFTGIHEVVAK